MCTSWFTRKWPRSLFWPVQARCWKNTRDQDGTRTGRGGPHLGTWMGPKCWKQSTWRIWPGPPRTRDGIWMGPGSDQARVWMAPSRDSNRLLGLSDLRALENWNFVFATRICRHGHAASPEGREFPEQWLRQGLRHRRPLTGVSQALWARVSPGA